MPANEIKTVLVERRGAIGRPGPVVNFLGPLPDEASLPADARYGDAYRVDGILHVYALSGWESYGQMVGIQGDPGRGIASISYDEETGELTLTLTDATEVVTGSLFGSPPPVHVVTELPEDPDPNAFYVLHRTTSL